MRSCSQDMSALYEQCINMRRDILTVSGMSKAHLDDATIELSEIYASWCYGYKGSDLADSYMGFCEMLHTGPLPWSYCEDSCMNGLRLSQFHFAWAYSGIELTLTALRKRQVSISGLRPRDSADFAATNAVLAAKALTHAKALVGTSGDYLAQASC